MILDKIHSGIFYLHGALGWTMDFLSALGASVEILRLKQIKRDLMNVNTENPQAGDGASLAPVPVDENNLGFFGWNRVLWDEDTQGVWIIGGKVGN